MVTVTLNLSSLRTQTFKIYHNKPKFVNYTSNTASSRVTRSVTAIRKDANSPVNDDSIVDVSNDHSEALKSLGMHAMNRCLVEDFMTVDPGKKVLLVVPIDIVNNGSFVDTSLLPGTALNEFTFAAKNGKKMNSTFTHFIMRGVVHSSPKCEDIRNGITDLDHAMGVGKYGSYINIVDDMNTDCGQVLVTWRDVVEGRKEGIQVWCELENGIRDCKRNFSNLHRNEDALKKLLRRGK